MCLKNSLALLPLSLADLGTVTRLDGRDGTSRSAGVAVDEVQTVFSSDELGIWRSAGLAGDVLN